MTLTKYCFDIQIVGQQCDAIFSLNKPLVNLAEIDSDSIKIDIRYFGPENFVGTRDSTAYQWLVTTSFEIFSCESIMLTTKARESPVENQLMAIKLTNVFSLIKPRVVKCGRSRTMSVITYDPCFKRSKHS